MNQRVGGQQYQFPSIIKIFAADVHLVVLEIFVNKYCRKYIGRLLGDDGRMNWPLYERTCCEKSISISGNYPSKLPDFILCFNHLLTDLKAMIAVRGSFSITPLPISDGKIFLSSKTAGKLDRKVLPN